MIRGVGELIPNFDHETLLSACFRDSEKEQHKILAKQVLNYVINTPSENKNHTEIIMRSFIDLLECPTIKDDLI